MVVYAIVDVRHQEQGDMLRGETALWHLRFVGGFLQGNQLLSPAREMAIPVTSNEIALRLDEGCCP